MARLLCVDTATSMESLALLIDGEPWCERAMRRTRGHGPGLLDSIDQVLRDAGLTLADLDGLVCGLGPGSFTGLRVALATLKGLALAHGTPLYGQRTTRALCAALPGQRTVALLDARRGEIYVDGADMPIPKVMAPSALRLPPGPVTLLGDGARLHADLLRAQHPQAFIPAAPALHVPRAALLAAGLDLNHPAPLATLEPVYVRRSDAEINYPDGFPDATVVPRQQHPRRPGETT